MRRYDLYVKITRPISLVISSVFLLLLCPLFLIVGFAIKLENYKNSIFFTQSRVGKDGKCFTIYKFTTMVISIPPVPTKELEKNYKLTALGKLLRNTQINELPQLFNVLLGSMRIIGPRPYIIQDTEIEKYRTASDLAKLTPGITFLDRVLGGENLSIQKREIIEKIYLKYDSILWYLCIECCIIFLTSVVVIRKLFYHAIIKFIMKNSKFFKFLLLVTILVVLVLLSTKNGAKSNAPNIYLIEQLQNFIGDLSESVKWWLTFAIRKSAHVIMYFFIYLTTYYFVKKDDKKLFDQIVKAFVIGVCIAIADEYLQSFIPDRTSKASDVLIDSIGLLLGSITIHFNSKKK